MHSCIVYRCWFDTIGSTVQRVAACYRAPSDCTCVAEINEFLIRKLHSNNRSVIDQRQLCGHARAGSASMLACLRTQFAEASHQNPGADDGHAVVRSCHLFAVSFRG